MSVTYTDRSGSTNLRALLAAGMPEREALSIEQRLTTRRVLPTKDLVKETAEFLASAAPHAVTDYLFWAKTFAQKIPLSILIGGVTGVGKSAIAFEMSCRLGNAIHIRLSHIRAVLQHYLEGRDRSFMRASSYNAWELLPQPHGEGVTVEAYVDQNQLLLPAVEALARTAVDLGTIMLLEGVNIDCSILRRLSEELRHNVFGFLVVVPDRDLHWQLLEHRHDQHPHPPVSIEVYRTYFEQIRRIQQFLMEQAAAEGIPTLDLQELTVESAATKVLHAIVQASAPA